MFTSTSLHTTTATAATLAADTPKSIRRNSARSQDISLHAQQKFDHLRTFADGDQTFMNSLPGPSRQPGENKPVRERGERVRINVSGRIFESYKSTLVSKEGSIFGMKSIHNYYNQENKEFFFDRDARVFEAILVYLQCGLLAQPEKVAFRNYIEDLQFFGFGRKAFIIYEKESVKAPSGNKNYGTWEELGTRKFVYHIMEHPDINIVSRFLAAFSSIVIFLSIIVYCVESLPNMTRKDLQILYSIEMFCVIWFTIELLSRFFLCPSKLKFLRDLMNVVDFVSILPFYMNFVLKEDENTNMVGIAMLRTLRIARVFRIFKLSRYSKAIFLIVITIRASVRELLLLLMFIMILMVLFAAAIYQFEHDGREPTNKFKSIPHTFWLVIVTITTVGYGDMVPITTEGKLITSVLTVTGVVVVALPIPIIVNNFTRYYEKIMSKSNSQKYLFEFDESKSVHQDKREDCIPPLIITQYETSM